MKILKGGGVLWLGFISILLAALVGYLCSSLGRVLDLKSRDPWFISHYTRIVTLVNSIKIRLTFFLPQKVIIN